VVGAAEAKVQMIRKPNARNTSPAETEILNAAELRPNPRNNIISVRTID